MFWQYLPLEEFITRPGPMRKFNGKRRGEYYLCSYCRSDIPLIVMESTEWPLVIVMVDVVDAQLGC